MDYIDTDMVSKNATKKQNIQLIKDKLNERYGEKSVSRETRVIVTPDYDPEYLHHAGYYTRPKHGHVHPFYMTNADYNTDSASYYDYLAKFNKLLNEIINQVNENTANIKLIFDMLDDIQNQIDNIMDIINDILLVLDDLQNQIDIIFDLLDDVPTIPDVSKYVSFDGVGSAVWYPKKVSDGGKILNLIPIPGKQMLEFQNIDIIWSDVDTSVTPHLMNNGQQSQFTHTGVILTSGSSDQCTDTVGDYGGGTIYSYTYGMSNDYTLIGGSISANLSNDIGLCKVLVSSGLPVNSNKVSNLTLTTKQKMLVDGLSNDIINKAYEYWLNIQQYGMEIHKLIAPLLTSYLNDFENEIIINEKLNIIFNVIETNEEE